MVFRTFFTFRPFVSDCVCAFVLCMCASRERMFVAVPLLMLCISYFVLKPYCVMHWRALFGYSLVKIVRHNGMEWNTKSCVVILGACVQCLNAANTHRNLVEIYICTWHMYFDVRIHFMNSHIFLCCCCCSFALNLDFGNTIGCHEKTDAKKREIRFLSENEYKNKRNGQQFLSWILFMAANNLFRNTHTHATHTHAHTRKNILYIISSVRENTEEKRERKKRTQQRHKISTLCIALAR